MNSQFQRAAVAACLRLGQLALLPLVLLIAASDRLSLAQESNEPMGLTEPYRTIDVAAAESGVVVELMVREARAVQRGQILAKLDSEVHLGLLAIAKQGMEARGRLEAARAEVQLRTQRFHSFQRVFADGHARQEELDRARTDLALAEAQLLSAEEDRLQKKLEYEKILLQIERRTIRAPIDGFVSQLHRDVGEYVAPNAPSVLTLVQLDPLLAIFSLSDHQAASLRAGLPLQVRFGDSETLVDGHVDMVSPTSDPESGTVLVKIWIDNPEGAFRSGQRCSLVLPVAVESPETRDVANQNRTTSARGVAAGQAESP